MTLSHVWDAAGEQDFQEFQTIWAEHGLSKKTVRSDVDDGALVPVRVELLSYTCLLKPQTDADSSLSFIPPSHKQKFLVYAAAYPTLHRKTHRISAQRLYEDVPYKASLPCFMLSKGRPEMEVWYIY